MQHYISYIRINIFPVELKLGFGTEEATNTFI